MRKIERPKSGQQPKSVFAATAVSVTMTVATAMVAFVVAVACFFAARAFAAAAAFTLFSVSVTATAFFFVSMMSMASAFFMTMTMVAASAGGRGFNVVLKRSGDESSNGDIAIAFVAGIKCDVGLRERLHGARSEAAANDAVDCIFHQKIHHGGVAVATRSDRFG